MRGTAAFLRLGSSLGLANIPRSWGRGGDGALGGGIDLFTHPFEDNKA